MLCSGSEEWMQYLLVYWPDVCLLPLVYKEMQCMYWVNAFGWMHAFMKILDALTGGIHCASV